MSTAPRLRLIFGALLLVHGRPARHVDPERHLISGFGRYRPYPIAGTALPGRAFRIPARTDLGPVRLAESLIAEIPEESALDEARLR